MASQFSVQPQGPGQSRVVNACRVRETPKVNEKERVGGQGERRQEGEQKEKKQRKKIRKEGRRKREEFHGLAFA